MSLNDKAEAMAAQNQPLSIVLCANSSTTGDQTTAGRQIDLNKIPTAICESSRVSVIFGQTACEQVHRMQLRNTTNASVGFLGAVMGAIARANVQESVAWVKQFNLFTDDFQEIELGFGDTNLDSEGELTSVNAYESFSPTLLDGLDDKGYMFPIKYAGRENGIYISRDQTCSHGDFRTIARNHTINKARRQVRSALLPYVNSPLMVNPSTGYLASSKIHRFQHSGRRHPLQDASRAGDLGIRGHHRRQAERPCGRHPAYRIHDRTRGCGYAYLRRGGAFANR